jgi:hypothetical protein
MGEEEMTALVFARTFSPLAQSLFGALNRRLGEIRIGLTRRIEADLICFNLSHPLERCSIRVWIFNSPFFKSPGIG